MVASGSEGKKMGVANIAGKILIDPAYDYLGTSVIKGIFYYSNKNTQGVIEGYGLMDSTGKKITTTSYFEFEKANDTVLVARKKEGSYDNKFCHYTLISVLVAKNCASQLIYIRNGIL